MTDWTFLIAVSALLLGIGNLGWSIYSYLDTKKRDRYEKLEKEVDTIYTTLRTYLTNIYETEGGPGGIGFIRKFMGTWEQMTRKGDDLKIPFREKISKYYGDLKEYLSNLPENEKREKQMPNVKKEHDPEWEGLQAEAEQILNDLNSVIKRAKKPSY